jgi:hypothetical protein
LSILINIFVQEIDGNGNAQVTPCDGTPTSAGWCCGANNTACCNTPNEMNLAATIGAATSSSASPTSSPTGTTITFPSATGTGNSSKLSTGAEAGIGIGGAVVLVAVLGTLVYICRRRTRHQREGSGAELGEFLGNTDRESYGNGKPEFLGTQIAEVSEIGAESERPLSELPTGDTDRKSHGEPGLLDTQVAEFPGSENECERPVSELP